MRTPAFKRVSCQFILPRNHKTVGSTSSHLMHVTINLRKLLHFTGTTKTCKSWCTVLQSFGPPAPYKVMLKFTYHEYADDYLWIFDEQARVAVKSYG